MNIFLILIFLIIIYIFNFFNFQTPFDIIKKKSFVKLYGLFDKNISSIDYFYDFFKFKNSNNNKPSKISIFISDTTYINIKYIRVRPYISIKEFKNLIISSFKDFSIDDIFTFQGKEINNNFFLNDFKIFNGSIITYPQFKNFEIRL